MKSGYITIQSWMRDELDLKGNDLLVYAIIYGFSQTENQKFTGSLQYIADWCGATKQGILKNLQNLLDAGLIAKNEKYVNNIKLVEYYSTEFNTHSTEFNGGVKLSLTNNIDNKLEENRNISNNKLLDIEKSTEKKPKQNLYQKCYSEIEEFTDDTDIRELLVTYLKMRLEIKDKPLYANQWKGMLNKLRLYSNSSKSEAIKIIQQSIDRGYLSFYEVDNKYLKKNNVLDQAWNKNVKCQSMTEEEKAAQEAEWNKLREQGVQVDF